MYVCDFIEYNKVIFLFLFWLHSFLHSWYKNLLVNFQENYGSALKKKSIIKVKESHWELINLRKFIKITIF